MCGHCFFIDIVSRFESYPLKPIAILFSDDLLPENQHQDPALAIECNKQLEQIGPAFDKAGLTFEAVPWRSAAAVAERYSAALPLFVWDYFEGNEVAFAQAATEVSQKTVLLNPVEQLHWNANKRYLDDLSQSGASVIETIIVDRIEPEDIVQAFEQFGVDKLVIKPLVGGGAWRQVLLERGDPFPDRKQLPPAEAMIQAFQPSVIAEGEFSFLFFNGKFSHALVKRAARGDYRIQAIYGGTEEVYSPTNDEKISAARILQSLPTMPLYARVDLLRGGDGQLKLIELELIEPFLYLAYSGEADGINIGATRLANCLLDRLSECQ